jgi:hypothetical protein
VEKRSINTYIFTGTALRYLCDAGVGWTVQGEGWVIANADLLQRDLQGGGLLTSLRVYEMAVRPVIEKFRAAPKDYKMTAADQVELRGASDTLRVTVLAEARGKTAYVVSDTRFASDKLLEDMGSLLGAGVFGSLSEIARGDLAAGGRCLAFGLGTAAAFHMLRATEDTLRVMYRAFVRRDRISSLLWGPIVVDLKSHRTKPSDALLANLDDIREHYRNPTQHPELTYDVEQAEDLLGRCIDAINRMVRETKARQART